MTQSHTQGVKIQPPVKAPGEQKGLPAREQERGTGVRTQREKDASAKGRRGKAHPVTTRQRLWTLWVWGAEDQRPRGLGQLCCREETRNRRASSPVGCTGYRARDRGPAEGAGGGVGCGGQREPSKGVAPVTTDGRRHGPGCPDLPVFQKKVQIRTVKFPTFKHWKRIQALNKQHRLNRTYLWVGSFTAWDNRRQIKTRNCVGHA